MSTPQTFYEFLVEERACASARKFVANRGGDFERSLRAYIATAADRGGDLCDLCWLAAHLNFSRGYGFNGRCFYTAPSTVQRAFGRFLRLEATARGWIKPRQMP